jgi:hypothetical protein
MDRRSISLAKGALIPKNCRIKPPSFGFEVSFPFGVLVMTSRAENGDTQNDRETELLESHPISA